MPGITPKETILRVLPHNVDTIDAAKITQIRAVQLPNIKELKKNLDNLHKCVKNRVNARPDRTIQNHNEATNTVTPSIAVGDFVLV